MTDKHTTPMFPVHHELTGIMHQQLEQATEPAKVIDLVNEHYYQQTSTNPHWNYSTCNPYDNIERLFNRVVSWQGMTFPHSTALSKIIHLSDEVKELAEALLSNDPNTHLEYADCFILLFGSAASNNMCFNDIVQSIKEKMEINKKRKWLTPDENGVVKHIKD